MTLARRALLLGLVVAAGGQAASAATLEEVMRGFAAVPESTARFREEKTLPQLEQPLVSSGTLHWRAPDRLEKRTLEPIEEQLSVAGDRLTLERPAQGVRQELSLDRLPEIRPLVEAVRSTLAGDLATLRHHYEPRFEEHGETWRLVLTPNSSRVLMVVQRIVLSGRGAEILSIETQAQDGTTRMWIERLR